MRNLREYSTEKTLLLDPATLRNLEIFKSAANTRHGSLLSAMDGTVTPPGARLLERWLCAPELNLDRNAPPPELCGRICQQPGTLD